MTTLLFIGDIVGEAGLAYLEARLPDLMAQYRPEFVIANAENVAITGSGGFWACGMAPHLTDRLFAAGVDLITGGNHSWDGPDGGRIHDDPRILRPINSSTLAPGRGAAIVEKGGVRLGIINAASLTALHGLDTPLDAIERQLAAWAGQIDALFVDFHGESVTEKLTLGHALAGRAIGVVGTHTHVRTLDTRVLTGGTAYVTDVGMTGPGEGIQGYAPDSFVTRMRVRLPGSGALRFAEGGVELGAVVIHFENGCAQSIERVLR